MACVIDWKLSSMRVGGFDYLDVWLSFYPCKGVDFSSRVSSRNSRYSEYHSQARKISNEIIDSLLGTWPKILKKDHPRNEVSKCSPNRNWNSYSMVLDSIQDTIFARKPSAVVLFIHSVDKLVAVKANFNQLNNENPNLQFEFSQNIWFPKSFLKNSGQRPLIASNLRELSSWHSIIISES